MNHDRLAGALMFATPAILLIATFVALWWLSPSRRHAAAILADAQQREADADLAWLARLHEPWPDEALSSPEWLEHVNDALKVAETVNVRMLRFPGNVVPMQRRGE